MTNVVHVSVFCPGFKGFADACIHIQGVSIRAYGAFNILQGSKNGAKAVFMHLNCMFIK